MLPAVVLSTVAVVFFSALMAPDKKKPADMNPAPQAGAADVPTSRTSVPVEVPASRSSGPVRIKDDTRFICPHVGECVPYKNGDKLWGHMKVVHEAYVRQKAMVTARESFLKGFTSEERAAFEVFEANQHKKTVDGPSETQMIKLRIITEDGNALFVPKRIIKSLYAGVVAVRPGEDRDGIAWEKGGSSQGSTAPAPK